MKPRILLVNPPIYDFSAYDFWTALDNLVRAGADPRQIHAYIIIGHLLADEQQVEDSIRFANRLGIRVMLSQFSPIPGTPDGESCRRWADLDEPLNHNQTAFTLLSLGEAETNRLKNLSHQVNQSLCATRAEQQSHVRQASY